MKREDIEKMVRPFVKKGDFETAAQFADHYGDFDLARKYMELNKKFKNKSLREIAIPGGDAIKDLQKGIVYFNALRPAKNPQTFSYNNYHLLNEEYMNLSKN